MLSELPTGCVLSGFAVLAGTERTSTIGDTFLQKFILELDEEGEVASP